MKEKKIKVVKDIFTGEVFILDYDSKTIISYDLLIEYINKAEEDKND